MLKMRSGQDDTLHIPPPPNDLVIITAMRREYWQNRERKMGRLGNVYFHCKVKCVKIIQPAFIPFLTTIPPYLRERLNELHKQEIAKELDIVL